MADAIKEKDEKTAEQIQELAEHVEQKIEMVERERASLAKAIEDKNKMHTEQFETHAIGLSLRPRSRPASENMIDRDICITISNGHFAFIAQHWTGETHMPRLFCAMGWDSETLVQRYDEPEGNTEDDSDSDDQTQVKAYKMEIFRVQPYVRYTNLHNADFQEKFRRSVICHASFGQPNVYIIEILNQGPQQASTPAGGIREVHQVLCPNPREEDQDMVNRIWWGHDNTYVAELQSWIIIFTNGEVAYSRRGSKSNSKFDPFELEGFATRNFGCDFGLIEESKMKATPRSSNPISKPGA
ncbi:hypothetical protein B0H63DRAFT_543748 [Podospora didyma]|uniref:Uncharacterized protein n=1 Tax=Podospora didyma TaxID=330526 RepID=A0AAE0NPT3_9PEZI|nr:hypothetical protein B0H63DRAFT_543748 [Podospora didyma]